MSEPRTLRLGSSQTLTVRRHDAEQLELEAEWGPGGAPPPAHLHPAQDERFEVLAGRLAVRVDGQERELATGDVLEVPRGTPHAMWNAGAEPARARWRTSPAGRTLEWFEAIESARPDAFPALLAEYEDVFRLTG